MDALAKNFEGGGVPREYAFHVRVTNKSAKKKTVTLRFQFTDSCGKGYMAPPYWIFRNHGWWIVPEAKTDFDAALGATVTVAIDPDEVVQVANKPYVTPTVIHDEMASLAEMVETFSVREIGRTAEDRQLLVLETEPRNESILVGATMQPAEPAGRPVIAVAHWLLDGSALTRHLLDRFQFCFLPMPNPDGSFHGRSVTNAVGEVPMFSFAHVLRGEEAPLESKAAWAYCEQLRPTAYLEFHTHYQSVRHHKLNPMWHGWFPENMQGRVTRVDKALLTLNSNWRVTEISPEVPLHDCGKFSNLTTHFHTMSYCYQIYTLTQEATCAHAIQVVSTLARALAGPEWEAALPDPDVEAG